MAPIDYSRFDDIDTSSSDDEDGDDTELEAGDAPSVVQLIDSFHQLVGHPDPDCPPWLGQDGVLSRLGLLTETQARATYRASDPLNNEDARPRRRRVALVKDDPNDAFFPPIFTERKKRNSRATEKKKKTRRTKEPCAACGTRTRKRCGACHKLGVHTPYCGASCQNAHWPTHRRACGERHPAIVARRTTSPTPDLDRVVVDAADERSGPGGATGARTQMSCNQACAARDANALAEALRAGRGSPDSDTCEIAAAWNALECLRVLRAHGCEMNEAACLVTAVRYGARDCVLWLKDGVLFPPPTGPAHPSRGWSLPPLARMNAFVENFRDAAMPHLASPLRTAFERANRIERDFASVKGFMGGVIRDAMLYGTRDEPAFRDPFSDDVDAADAGPDEEDVDPLVVRFPAGAIVPPPGYEVVDAWGIY